MFDRVLNMPLSYFGISNCVCVFVCVCLCVQEGGGGVGVEDTKGGDRNFKKF